MTHERRYSEAEVRQIFSLATTRPEEPDGPASAPDEGLTLGELREIGAEVGVEPGRIADAAAVLDARREVEPRRTHFGMPISAGRVVELEREPTDAEWELLVAECRRTFDARGKVLSAGRSQEWRNGNLHVTVEPSGSGFRLRMGTRKSNAAPLNLAGAGGIVMALVTLFTLVTSGAAASEFVTPAVFATLGVAALGMNGVRLPRWVRDREEQMAFLADQAEAIIEDGDPGP